MREYGENELERESEGMFDEMMGEKRKREEDVDRSKKGFGESVCVRSPEGLME